MKQQRNGFSALLIKKTILFAATAVLAIATSATVSAAETVELKVTGTITPDACIPTISGGGVVDYGKILASSLKYTEMTSLPGKKIDLTVSCDSALKFGVKMIDNRSSSTMSAGNPGLGMADSTTKIGAVLLWVETATGDGEKGVVIKSGDSGVTWEANANNTHLGWMLGIAPTGTLLPAAYKTGKFEVGVESRIRPASELPLTKEVTLDGSITFEMVYL